MYSKLTLKEFAKLYGRGMSYTQIAQALGITTVTCWRWRKELALPERPKLGRKLMRKAE
jgi:hypothetical protein